MKRNIITSVALLLVLVTACAHDVSGNDDEALRTWQAGATVSIKAVEKYGMDRCFTSEPIPDAVFERMKGKSYPDGCLVKRSELRYLRVLHIDFEGKTHLGEMVCNESIAADLVDIFRQLYAARYPIERMVLIDNYDAKDEMLPCGERHEDPVEACPWTGSGHQHPVQPLRSHARWQTNS